MFDKPLVPIAIAFALGIGLALFAPVPVWVSCVALAVLLPIVVIRGGWRVVVFVAVLAGYTRALPDIDEVARPPPRQAVPVQLDGCVHDVRDVRDGTRVVLSSGGTRGSVFVPRRRSVEPGDVVRADVRAAWPGPPGNPGQYDARLRLQRRGIGWVGSVRRIAVTVPGGCRGPLQAMAGARRDYVRMLQASLEPREAAVAAALSTGERGSAPTDVIDAFRRTGTVHVLVVSGLHLSVLLMIVYGGVRAVLLRIGPLAERYDVRTPAALVALASAAAFALYTGGGIPMQRALVAAAAGLFALMGGSQLRLDRWNVLAAGALVVMAFDPFAIQDAGFQLSFAAMAGILSVSPIAQRRERRLRRGSRVWKTVMFSAGATLATWPVAAWHFGRLPALGLVANVWVLPVMAGLCVPLLLVSAMLHPVLPVVSTWIAVGLEPVLSLCIDATLWAARLPAASHGVVLSPASLLLWIGVLGVWRARGRLRWAVGACAVVAAGIAVVVDGVKRPANDELSVTFLSVGHGDAAVVRFPNDDVLVIDGGMGSGIVLPALRRMGVRRVDYMALSHAHPDHMEGLTEVVRMLPTRELWFAGGEPGPSPTSETYPAWEILKAHADEVLWVGQGTPTRTIGGVRVEFLHPEPRAGAERNPRERNNRSMVLRLVYGRRALLFTGDVEAKAEGELMRRNGALWADVLKVPHHGSRTSSTRRFLERVGARHAVISTGPSPWKLPSPEVVERYRGTGARIWRTDCQGAVEVRTDGEALRVNSRHPRGPC